MKGLNHVLGMAGMFFVFTITLRAQTSPKPMSLKDCAQYAIQNSPQVKKSLLEVERGDQKVKEILSAGLPQVNASGQFLYNVELPTQLLPGEFFGAPGETVPVQFGTKLNSTAGIEVSQLVFSRTFFIGLGATRKLSDLNKLVVGKTQEQLAFDVAQLYYQVQVIAKQKQILQANLNQVDRLLQLTAKQQENGFAKKTDVDQLRVNKINLENQLQNLDLQIEQLMSVLKLQMAMPLDQPIILTDTIDEQAFQAPAIGLSAPDFSHKTEMAILDLRRELYQLNVEQYRAGYWPTMRFFGNYNIQGQGNDFGELGSNDRWFRYGAIGLSLNIPIFDGFQKKAQIAQANIDLAQLAEDRRQTTQSLQLQYGNAKRQLQTQLNNLQALSENMKVAQEVYTVAQKRFKEGVAIVTELLTAETSMREAQTNYLTALLQLKMAELELQNAQGTLLQNLN